MYTRKKRAISILVIALFMLSMISILPVAAITNVSVSGYVKKDSFYIFQDSAKGIADWSTDKAHSGSYSVKLVDGGTITDYARVVIEMDIDFDDISSISYWFNYTSVAPAIGAYAFPYLIFELDTSGNGIKDEWVVQHSGGDPYQPTTNDIWMKWDSSTDDTKAKGNWFFSVVGADNGTLSEIQDDIDGTVLAVKVAVGETWAYGVTAYIDDIEINGATHRLEPKGADKGDELAVSGIGVTSGTTVNVYWDFVTSAGLVNNTQANPDGTFDCEVDVPSDYAGFHYIWAKDVTTGDTLMYDAPILVLPKISLSPSSGLIGDEITVTGYGFSKESVVKLYFNGTVLSTSPSTVETDELGYFTCTFDIPQSGYSSDHMIKALDDKGFQDSVKFTVGASITLTPDEGPTGTIVTVEGRGWSKKGTMTFVVNETVPIPIKVVDNDVVTINNDGTFSAEIVMPAVGSVDEYSIAAEESNETDTKGPAAEDFDVTGVSELVVSPTYGTPGATITVKGYNFTQISGTKVYITMDSEPAPSDLVTAVTDADGTFEDTFVSPAVEFISYTVTAVDEYSIDADDAFKVGLIALIINPIYGEAGTMVSITGIGFLKDSKYNVTFGTKLYEEYGDGVTSAEAISDLFYVPNFDPGTYDLTVVDEDENELTVQFTLTESTYVIADPAVAPNNYNVSIKGYHFADIENGKVDFVLYNSTDDWNMDVNTHTATGDITTVMDDDGNFTGHWHVPLKDEISLGDYTMNITDSEGLLVQIPFSVVAARVSVAPRKAEFDRGDMIQFDIKNDFKLGGSYIEIYDPYDTLYWITEPFTDGTGEDPDMWLLVEGLYTVPYYRQTAAENPMELQSDAPMGAWLYIFYDVDDEQLMNGTFSVGPSTAAQVDEKLTEIWASMEDLSTDIDSITDELGDDIDALSGEIDDVVADVQDMIDDITSDLAGELAQVAEDTEAAVSDLEGAIGDIASAQNELASELDAIGQDTTDAKEAAEDAQKSATGLTTLVYGAIGASLIAALAAIVSLMQISKKIA